MNVIVIGGGMAGLGAAWRLQQAGVTARVLEATDRAGGRAYTEVWEGFDVDPGAQCVDDNDSLLMQLVDQLGLRSDLRPHESPLADAVLLQGDAWSTFSPALPSALAWRRRLETLRLGRRRNGHGRPESLPGDPRTTVDDYLAGDNQAGLLESWAGPLLAWQWGWLPGDVAAPVFLHLQQELVAQRAWTFRNGIGSLPRALAARLQVTTGARVTEVAAGERGARVTFLHEGAEETVEADAAVIAVPGTLVSGLLQDVPPGWAPLLERVTYSAGLAVFLALDVPAGLEVQPPCRLLGLGEEGVLAGLAVVARGRGGRRMLVRAVPRMAGELLLHREDDIYALIQGEVPRLCPELSQGAHPAWRLFRWPAQAPCWRPGYLAALREARPYLRQGPLFLAGDYLAGPGLGAALADGWACAAATLKYLQRAN